MQIINDLNNFNANWNESVVCLGDFDGFHRGHKKLIQNTVSWALKTGRDPILITYDPSPKKVLKKLKHDSNIYTKAEKISLLQEFNLRAVIFIPFNLKMAKMTASDFLKQVLLKKIKAKNIVLGYDHHFGRNRHGNFKYLNLASKRYDFSVRQIKPFKLWQETVSSTKIRKFLVDGLLSKANRFLGSPYIIMGTIIKGKQRGRQFGVPTANLHIESEKLLPQTGVYFGYARYGDKKYKAVINIGKNPTFNNQNISIEANILNFSKDIYGETLTICLQEKIRDEKKFDSIDELKEQIFKDIQKAKKK